MYLVPSTAGSATQEKSFRRLKLNGDFGATREAGGIVLAEGHLFPSPPVPNYAVIYSRAEALSHYHRFALPHSVSSTNLRAQAKVLEPQLER